MDRKQGVKISGTGNKEKRAKGQVTRNKELRDRI
jgi:hypothetical protein